MRDKPRESTGAARLSRGGLPPSLSALAPVDACIRPRPALPRMRPTQYLNIVPGGSITTIDGYACYDGMFTGFGTDMQEAYKEWARKQAGYYWPVQL